VLASSAALAFRNHLCGEHGQGQEGDRQLDCFDHVGRLIVSAMSGACWVLMGAALGASTTDTRCHSRRAAARPSQETRRRSRSCAQSGGCPACRCAQGNRREAARVTHGGTGLCVGAPRRCLTSSTIVLVFSFTNACTNSGVPMGTLTQIIPSTCTTFLEGSSWTVRMSLRLWSLHEALH